MRPFINCLLQSAGEGVRSFFEPNTPKAPTSSIGALVGIDADSNTTTAATTTATPPPPQEQNQRPATPTGEERERAATIADATIPPPLPATPDEKRAGVNADTPPSLPATPEDAESDTTIVVEESETPEEKKRRKRKEKKARRRERRSGGSDVGLLGGAGGAGAAESARDDGSAGAARSPVEDEGASPRGRAAARSEDAAGAEGGQRVDSRRVEGGDEAGSNQAQIGKADDGGEATKVEVEEVEGEEEHCLKQSEGENTTEEQPLVDDLTTTNIKLERTAQDPRCSALRLRTLKANNNPLPQTTTPTYRQLYPKTGLGPTIEIPSESFHIDTLNPPPPPTPTTTTHPSLANLHSTDLSDPLRAAHLSVTAHAVLTDRLWRTVSLANYFLFDRYPANTNITLPKDFPSMTPEQKRTALTAEHRKLDGVIFAVRPSREAVERGVGAFLKRVENSSGDTSEQREMRNRFTKANGKMALLLHEALAKDRLVNRRVLWGMFVESYCGCGVDWGRDVWGLGVVFCGRER